MQCKRIRLRETNIATKEDTVDREKIAIKENTVERGKECNDRGCDRERKTLRYKSIRLREKNIAIKEDTVTRDKYSNKRGYG